MAMLWFKDDALLIEDDALSLADDCCCDQGLGIIFSTSKLGATSNGRVFLEIPASPYYSFSDLFLVNGFPPNSTGQYVLVPYDRQIPLRYWVIRQNSISGLTSAWYWNGTIYTELNTGLPDVLNTTLFRGFTVATAYRIRSGLYNQNDNGQMGIIVGTPDFTFPNDKVFNLQEWYWNGASWIAGINYTPLNSVIPMTTTRNYINNQWGAILFNTAINDEQILFNGTILPTPLLSLFAQNPLNEADRPVRILRSCEIFNNQMHVAFGYNYFAVGGVGSGVAITSWNGSSWNILNSLEFPLDSGIYYIPYDVDLKSGEFTTAGGEGGSHKIAYNDFNTRLIPPFGAPLSQFMGVLITGNWVITSTTNTYQKTPLTFLGTPSMFNPNMAHITR